MNIHNINFKKINNENDLKIFLLKKVEDKLEDKTQKLGHNEIENRIIVDGTEIPFVVTPIIWCKNEDLQYLIHYKNVFTEIINLQYLNLSPFMCLIPYENENTYYFEFYSLDNLPSE
jgi:hypothetical protein